MDANTFKNSVTADELKAVCDAAGTSPEYFSQIAHGHRRPSVELAEKLVEASGNRLAFEKLMRAKRKKQAA